MLTIDLNGKWKMKRTKDTSWIEANVPGSVCSDLLDAGFISDPFYRDNEDEALELANDDYEYCREFYVDDAIAAMDWVELSCDGLDTLAEIYINDMKIADTNNMHRTYKFDLKHILQKGTNHIRILLKSPLGYMADKQEQSPLWGEPEVVAGYAHIRKAHYMLGWDWGPQIPDAGIWRSISINGYSHGRLEDVYITQIHSDEKVQLDVRVQHEKKQSVELTVEAVVRTPDDKKIVEHMIVEKEENHVFLDIDNPKLWWPNGYGSQPLYEVEILLKQDKKILDSRTMTIGLRTLTVRRQEDKWGESFEFNVNGVSIFAMGANYIPEDNLLYRCNIEKTETLIKECIEANFNCIRVWGGGIFAEDYFYDLCDKYGLIVWQDLMFACAVYEMNEEFTENIKMETIDNMKRLRHHPCLGLWCGNNEMEWGWVEWNFPKTSKLRTDYIKQFEIILPEIAEKVDPNTFYWVASPSSGGGFEDPNNDNIGDVHYWAVWHKLLPFTDYRNHYFRFCSEFGFQSFPCLKTVKEFTLPEDRNIFSYVMEKHQKDGDANGKILYYLSDTFKYPKNFDSLLYASQLLQAEAIKYGVEHWRRNRGRCMGAIYWQLNDCWPVASWSSIDWYGRWKALHYYAKRFFAPLLLSAHEEDSNVKLYVTNETMDCMKGHIIWRLRNNGSDILQEGKVNFEIEPLTAQLCSTHDFEEILTDKLVRRETYFEYFLYVNGVYVSSGTSIFVKPKHFNFMEPEICALIEECQESIIIQLSSKAYAKGIELDLADMDCVFSDNYFDLSAGDTRTIEVKKERLSKKITIDEFRDKLTIRSIFDIT